MGSVNPQAVPQREDDELGGLNSLSATQARVLLWPTLLHKVWRKAEVSSHLQKWDRPGQKTGKFFPIIPKNSLASKKKKRGTSFLGNDDWILTAFPQNNGEHKWIQVQPSLEGTSQNSGRHL